MRKFKKEGRKLRNTEGREKGQAKEKIDERREGRNGRLSVRDGKFRTASPRRTSGVVRKSTSLLPPGMYLPGFSRCAKAPFLLSVRHSFLWL